MGSGDLVQAVLYQARLLRSTASYVLFPGEKWERLSSSYHTMRPSKVGLPSFVSLWEYVGISRALQTKHTAALGVITPASLQGKAKFPGTESLIPLKLLPQLQTGLAKSAPGQGHRTNVLFVISSGPLRKPWLGLAPNNQAIHIHMGRGVWNLHLSFL